MKFEFEEDPNWELINKQGHWLLLKVKGFKIFQVWHWHPPEHDKQKIKIMHCTMVGPSETKITKCSGCGAYKSKIPRKIKALLNWMN